MTQRLLTFLLLLQTIALAQPKLDKCHLLLDGSLSSEEAQAQGCFVFNSLKDAVAHLPDTATLYIKPWVYWADDPDDETVAVGKNGREPFGMVISGKKLHFIGLCSDARDVVIASARGQMQGAVGNFTMLDCHVDELTVENLTMGNFCNADLDYPLHPELGRKKRSEAITQAHVGYVSGRSLVARNVRFISRLNLNPLNGAKESLYENCHFECTDDALNGGRAIYRHCDFDLYGAKPMWSTFGTGPLFYDCDFYVRTNNRETYFCKQGGPVTVVNCRYHAPEGSYVGWTAYPQRWLRCYQKDFYLNGQPYIIGNRQPQNTVIIGSNASERLNSDISTLGSVGSYNLNFTPFLKINQHEAHVTSPALLTLQSEPDAMWRVEKGFTQYATIEQNSDGMATVQLTNDTDETAIFCIVAYTEDGREAACQITMKPSILPPPSFIRRPSIVIEGLTARLDYELNLEGRHDESRITWLRDNTVVAVSNDGPLRTYRLSEADAGHRLSANIIPMHQRSKALAPTIAEIKIGMVPRQDSLVTDFSDLPCQWQPRIMEGCWTVDGHKPIDTSEHPWAFNPDKPMWEYGQGFNGAIGKGLLQAQRGARLMYTPIDRNKWQEVKGESEYGNMSLTLQVNPTKTAGQGFGSATGQYMDVCLKFDTPTLSGFGLRIERTPKSARAVDFCLVRYINGKTEKLTPPVTATCYRTGCTIALRYEDGTLTADVTTTTPKPEGSQLPHEVHLTAPVPPIAANGIHIQHTGSCGESTTMLHRLKAVWE